MIKRFVAISGGEKSINNMNKSSKNDQTASKPYNLGQPQVVANLQKDEPLK